MGRWLVILSLAIAQCPDTVVASPQSSDIPLPKPRPTHRNHPAPVVDAVAGPRPALPVVEAGAVESPTEQPSLQESQAQQSPAQESPAQTAVVLAVPVKSGRANRDCSGGKRIVSAYYWEGRRTASGQPFDPHGMTAAHRTLPFGTHLTVSNPRTGKTVTVVVNDRGPFVSGVNLDLALGAAQAIGMRGTGTVCIW